MIQAPRSWLAYPRDRQGRRIRWFCLSDLLQPSGASGFLRLSLCCFVMNTGRHGLSHVPRHPFLSSSLYIHINLQALSIPFRSFSPNLSRKQVAARHFLHIIVVLRLLSCTKKIQKCRGLPAPIAYECANRLFVHAHSPVYSPVRALPCETHRGTSRPVVMLHSSMFGTGFDSHVQTPNSRSIIHAAHQLCRTWLELPLAKDRGFLGHIHPRPRPNA